ncbi:MAG: diguanylate cyclase domain-containing protein [Campylobacterota bacterium]
MLNRLIKFFLLKNTLFLKIILVFTLPAIGMLYFSTVLVYDKIKTLSEVTNVQKNLKYTSTTQDFISSLQKERSLALVYDQNRVSKNRLQTQIAQTNKQYEQYLNINLKLDLKTHIDKSIKQVQDSFYKIKSLREKILNKSKKHKFDFFDDYNLAIESLISTLYDIKPIESATRFNNKFSYLINILVQKENASIKKMLVSKAILSSNISMNLIKQLEKTDVLEQINKDQFLLKANLNEINKYKHKLPHSLINEIKSVENQIKNQQYPKITFEKWWSLSSKKDKALDEIYDFLFLEIDKYAKQMQEDAYIAQTLSLTFLLVSFATLISLLFVLRSIILNEQKSFVKIKKQQEVYKLLNRTNKFLLKIDDEKILFSKICKLISQNHKMSYAFIYKIKDNENHTLISQEGELKNILDKRFKSENYRANLVSKVLEKKDNIIVYDYDEDQSSFISDIAQEFNIKSAAAFPIKKFEKIISVLVLYSNESNFFDEEIEILFEKMINDMTHALEKIDYEKNRKEQESELKLASYAFESNEPMIITDDNSFIINANNAFCKVMGYSKKEVIGRRPSMFKSKHQDKKFYENMWNILLRDGAWSGEIYNTKKNKQKIPLRATITAIKDSDGNTTHYLGQYIDISEQVDRQKVLEYQATHDNLTGLPNRLLLLDRLEHAITKTVRHNVVGGLIFIDLDNFKIMNDTLGHDIGDKLLFQVAQKLKETVRDEDTIARIGGDEFIVLIDCIGSDSKEAKQNLEVLASKVKTSLNDIKQIDGNKNMSTPSIGVTLFKDASINPKQIIKQADTAMYAAKKQGKNAIEFFN